VKYDWTFGDGGTSSGTTATVSHTYAAVGTYTAKVTVTDNSGGTNSATATISATADPNVIAAPTSLVGSTSRKGSVTLTWKDNSTNEQGFHIERAPSGSTTYTVVGSVGVNVTTFTQSLASGTYNFRVQAYNQTTGHVSAYSNVVTVKVK
jgi:PKD repeat protein